MDELQDKLDLINKKLDMVLLEVDSQKVHRKAMEDLNSDLMKIGESTYDIALKNLEEISEYTSIENIFYFLKKIARNIDNLTKLFTRLESLVDFWESFEPLTREMAILSQDYLDNLEKMGYFEFLKEVKNLMDSLVENLTAQDLKQINLLISNAIKAFKYADAKESQNLSLIGMLKLLNTKEIKQALAFFVSFIQNFNKINT